MIFLVSYKSLLFIKVLYEFINCSNVSSVIMVIYIIYSNAVENIKTIYC